MGGRGVLTVVILVALAALTGWALVQTQRSLRTPARAPVHEPDYALQDLALQVLGPDGRTRYRLWAQRMVHYPDTDQSDLDAPRLRWFPQAGGAPWNVRSARGQVSGHGREILLLGTVHMDRPRAAKQPPLRIVTRDLRVLPKEELAETAARATLYRDDAALSGVGLRAYWRLGRVRLLSAVSGTYAPSRP